MVTTFGGPVLESMEVWAYEPDGAEELLAESSA